MRVDSGDGKYLHNSLGYMQGVYSPRRARRTRLRQAQAEGEGQEGKNVKNIYIFLQFLVDDEFNVEVQHSLAKSVALRN